MSDDEACCDVCGGPMRYVRCEECDGSGDDLEPDDGDEMDDFTVPRCGNCDGLGGWWVCMVCDTVEER